MTVDTVGDICGEPAIGVADIVVDCFTRWMRGDANGDQALDISDAVYSLSFLFIGGPEPSCLGAADVDADGWLDITDPIYVLGFLFLGSLPPLGWPDCDLFLGSNCGESCMAR